MSIRSFFKLESTSGVILFAAAIFAIIIDNSPLTESYQKLFNSPFTIQLASWAYSQTILFWINEGLMTIFFLLIGLELKRELLTGEMKGSGKALLPAAAALGGMLVPAIIYSYINHGMLTAKGWSIPVATDIAFALGVLSLFGRRVPTELKLFLMALAIFDDVGAILIIALFYTQSLSGVSLLFALGFILILSLLNYFQVKSLVPYIFIGFLLWICVLNSGVHATVAGVILAFMIPAGNKSNSPSQTFEKKLHPWVAYFVMPLFAFANAGVSFKDMGAGSFSDKLTLGVISGLVLGKQLGVFAFSWLMIKSQWAKLPKHTSWLDLYGVAWLCGIGFTMSLFLGTLAFQEDGTTYLARVRLGVLLGSIISGVIGAIILSISFSKGGGKIGAP